MYDDNDDDHAFYVARSNNSKVNSPLCFTGRVDTTCDELPDSAVAAARATDVQ